MAVSAPMPNTARVVSAFMIPACSSASSRRIVDYLSVSDVLLLPSEQESFGLAALEAMACELPVIASRVGGIPEVVTDGETGFLSEVGDVEKMANDAGRLLTDDDFRRKMGRRARESALSRYRTDLVIPQYIEFYEKILAGKGRWRFAVKRNPYRHLS